ncbi:DMT family transporter [Ancylobacter dichloromethanicus]
MIAGSSIFSTNDAFSKLALEHIPPSQILAVRGVMAALFLIAVLGWKGQLPALRFVADWRVMARAVAEACVAMLFITAITKMSIADATAILQVTPLATMVVAVLFFGARIGWRQWLAVAVGFAGVMLIVKPASSAFDAMALLPLGAALLMAFRDFITGRIGAHVPTLVVTFGTTVVGMGFGFAGRLGRAVARHRRGDLRLSGGGQRLAGGRPHADHRRLPGGGHRAGLPVPLRRRGLRGGAFRPAVPRHARSHLDLRHGADHGGGALHHAPPHERAEGHPRRPAGVRGLIREHAGRQLRVEHPAGDLGAAHRKPGGIEQPELHQHARLVPIDVLVRNLVVLEIRRSPRGPPRPACRWARGPAAASRSSWCG